MKSLLQSNLGRYLLIVIAAFCIGFSINLVMRNGWGDLDFFSASFYLVIAMYSIFHIATLSVIAILSATLSIRIRSILYISSSIMGFLVSMYILHPSTFDGVHLFVIFWGSLVLVALDYVWRANRQSSNEKRSS